MLVVAVATCGVDTLFTVTPVAPAVVKLLETEDFKVDEELVNVAASDEAVTVDPAGMVTVYAAITEPESRRTDSRRATESVTFTQLESTLRTVTMPLAIAFLKVSFLQKAAGSSTVIVMVPVTS